MELIFILLGGYFWYVFVQLRGRVEKLEERLGVQKEVKAVTPLYNEYTTPTPVATGQQTHASTAAAQEIQSVGDAGDTPFQPYMASHGVSPATSVPQAAYVAATPSGFENFISWLKKDFLMKVGALLLLMGLGWFVSYAFMNNWIGPMGRILLGLLTGASILILGAWRIKSYEHQGAIFMVLGSGTVLLTVFAARALYDFFTPTSALLLMFATVLFVALVSVKYKRNSLALAGLIIAGIAPYLTFSPMPLLVEQFMYLFVVVAGTLWVVYFTGWRNLTLTALIIVFLETLPFFDVGESSFIVLMWVFLFVAIFFIANIVSILRVQGMALSKAHLLTALGTAFFLVLWVFGAAPEEYQSLLLAAWMIVFSFGAYIVYWTTAERAPFYVYGGTSIALLAAATAAELNGAVLTIAYTGEVTALIIAAMVLRLGDKVITSLSALFVVPVILSSVYISSSSWRIGVFHEDFFVLLIITLTTLILGLVLMERARGNDAEHTTRVLGNVFLAGGVGYILILTALINTGAFAGSASTAKEAVLTMVYVFEVLAILQIARSMQYTEATYSLLSWLFLIPVMLSPGHIASAAWKTGVFHYDFFALLVLVCALVYESLVLRRCIRMGILTTYAYHTVRAYVILAVLYILTLIWLVTHGLFTDDVATMFALIIYTIIGLALFFIGRVRNIKYLAVSGGILIGFVVLRLLLVDVWMMGLAGRITTFLAIGTLLISTAFMKGGTQQTTHNES
jgi:uncharacterized membrane protein